MICSDDMCLFWVNMRELRSLSWLSRRCVARLLSSILRRVSVISRAVFVRSRFMSEAVRGLDAAAVVRGLAFRVFLA